VTDVHGLVAPGFEEVRDEFARNFAERDEVGAACAVYHRGQCVVDLWGGHRDMARTLPWNETTSVLVLSATKGIAAMTLAMAMGRGLLALDEPVATYWPEFAQAGKQDVTVRQLLAYSAGLAVLDEPITPELLRDTERLDDALARQAPAWAPGRRHGYHPNTLGFFQSALLRRVDGRSVGQFLRDELTKGHDVTFHIGLPDDADTDDIATHNRRRDEDTAPHAHKIPPAFLAELTRPDGICLPAFNNPVIGDASELGAEPWSRLDMPSVNGIGQARAMAKLYGLFATRSSTLGLAPRHFDELEATPQPPPDGRADMVLGVPSSYSVGFWKPSADWRFGTDGRAYGTPGGGGSMGLADPATGTGFAYVMNRFDHYLVDDPRELALREAAFRCLRRIRTKPQVESRAG
jgi:CubicO group peptidase (beta-lactamase class C family)